MLVCPDHGFNIVSIGYNVKRKVNKNLNFFSVINIKGKHDYKNYTYVTAVMQN
jgi:hypothetical protein